MASALPLAMANNDLVVSSLVRCLTIAGSDSSGGAGIQADLKTFAALGVYGMSAITAITAQNTHEVRAIHPVPADIIKQQIQAVAQDIGVSSVKIGMLDDCETIEAVKEALEQIHLDASRTHTPDPTLLNPAAAVVSSSPPSQFIPVVLDPVLIRLVCCPLGIRAVCGDLYFACLEAHCMSRFAIGFLLFLLYFSFFSLFPLSSFLSRSFPSLSFRTALLVARCTTRTQSNPAHSCRAWSPCCLW